MKRIAALLFILFCVLHISFAEPQFKLSLNVIGYTLSGGDLTKSGYVWADKDYLEYVPIIPIGLPVLSADFQKKQNRGEKPALISTNYKLSTSLSPVGVTASGETSISFTPLLTFTAMGGIQTAWNYGSSVQMLGLYNPAEKDYDGLTSFSEFSYTFGGEAKLLIPFNMNMIQLSYNSSYFGFTGADDKEVWKCAQMNNCVNGWKYKASCMLARRFNYDKLKMLAIITSADGWYSDSYFDDIYKPYNPDFVQWSITPMVQMQLTKTQSLMINGVITRGRSFEDNDYDDGEELMQVYEKANWKFKSFMIIWHKDLI